MKVFYSFIITAILFFSHAAKAQQLPLTVFAPRNGALFSGANSIFQDSQGWMWFTTTYDVLRYDGHIFKTYRPSAGTKMNFCYRVLEVDKEIWVLADPYPLKVVGDSLQPLLIKDLPEIRSSLSRKGRTFFVAKDGLYEFNDAVFIPLIRDDSLDINTDECLLALNDTLFASYSWSKKLVIFDLKNKTVQSFNYPVYDMRQDRTGRTFVLIKGRGIFEIKPVLAAADKASIDSISYMDIHDTRADQFIIDSQDNFWIAIQDNSLVKRGPGNTINYYKESDGLPSLWFHDMYRDREGNIWVGFNSGLCKIKNIHSKRYTINQGLYSNHIYYFVKANGSSQGYIVTRSGVNVVTGNKIFSVKTAGEAPFTCNHLLAEGQQLFYLRDSALYSAQIDTITYHVTHERRLTVLPAKTLNLTKDKNGTIFIASDRGLFSYRNNKAENILGDAEHYHTVLADSRDRLWAARFSGELLAFTISYKNGLLSLNRLHAAKQSTGQFLRRPRALTEDKFGNIYAGTRYDGLFYISTNGDTLRIVQRWTETDKLKSNSVWGIATDASGDCWVATARGINRISKTGTGSSVIDEGAAAQLYQGSSVFIANDNHVWIASHPGVVVLEKQKTNTGSFSTFITGFSVNGKPIHANDSDHIKKFSYRQNNISIDFSGNTFLDEEEVVYTYRLLRNGKGEWGTAALLHSVSYPALLPGSYRFEVKAENNRGTESDNIAAWAFEILPPFWQQSWFVLLIVLVVMTIIYLLYRYRIRQLVKLQQMRNNISRNLHDDIGASLTNINILNTLAMRNLGDKQKATASLQQAGEDIQRISESLSDIVWNINPMNDDLDNLFRYMKRYAADMLEGKNINAILEFPAAGNRVNLTMEKRHDFFLIFKEAVNNLAKYSKATVANILVQEEKGHIHMLIEDNGVGYEPGETSGGNGLINMKERASKLRASLKMESEKGKGTRIELKMKV